jgi:hypothetical protein
MHNPVLSLPVKQILFNLYHARNMYDIFYRTKQTEIEVPLWSANASESKVSKRPYCLVDPTLPYSEITNRQAEE